MGVAVAAPRHQLASNTMQPAACSYRRHPWLWIAAALVLAGLILLITLCAVLLGQGAPSFVFGPSLVGTSGYGFDVQLALDRAGSVAYVVVPTQDLIDDTNLR